MRTRVVLPAGTLLRQRLKPTAALYRTHAWLQPVSLPDKHVANLHELPTVQRCANSIGLHIRPIMSFISFAAGNLVYKTWLLLTDVTYARKTQARAWRALDHQSKEWHVPLLQRDSGDHTSAVAVGGLCYSPTCQGANYNGK